MDINEQLNLIIPLVAVLITAIAATVLVDRLHKARQKLSKRPAPKRRRPSPKVMLEREMPAPRSKIRAEHKEASGPQPGLKLSGIKICPRCKMKVFPLPDGTCPSCQAKIL